MQITLNLESVGHFLLVLAGIVLLVILCVAAVKLVKTLKSVNSILEDVNVVSSAISDKTREVDNIIGVVSESVANISETLKGNQNAVNAISVIVNSIATIKGFFTKGDSTAD